MLKLKLQYFGHLMRKNWLIGKDPDARKDWRQEEKGTDRGWDGWMASPTWWTWVWASFRSWWWTGKCGVLQSMGLQRVGQDSMTELNWTKLTFTFIYLPGFFFFGGESGGHLVSLFCRAWSLYSFKRLFIKKKMHLSCYVQAWALQACVLSCFSHVWPFVIQWTVAHQAPLSRGFSRQEY